MIDNDPAYIKVVARFDAFKKLNQMLISLNR